jgi:hypothetical protein
MKTRNLTLALLALVAIVPLTRLLGDDVPAPYTFARYQAMLDRSPFAVATAVAAPAATPNFAKDLYIANAAHSKDGDFVTIASSADKNFKKYLSGNTPDDGYSITNVEWSDKVGATKVTIAKDGQTATLTFNEALLKQTSVAAAPQQPQVQQPQMQQPNAVQAQPIVPPPVAPQPSFQQQRVAPVPQLPTPPPRVRGVIPKNPNVAPAPVPAVTVAPTPEVEL